MTRCQQENDDKNVIHEITKNGQVVAKLFYDEESDQIYFKNKTGKTIPFDQKKRGFEIKEKESNIKSFLSVWKPHRANSDEIVIFEGGIYQCITETESSPDGWGWKLLLDTTPFNFQGVWEPGEFEKNSCVIDPETQDYFISQNKIISTDLPSKESQDTDDWKLFMKKEIQQTTIPLVHAFFTNGSCCFKYDIKQNRCVFAPEVCPYEHEDPDQSQIYLPQKININEETNLIIPLNFVTYCDSNYFKVNQDPKTVEILKLGIYRVSYSVTYHGKLTCLTSQICTVEEESKDQYEVEPILYSINHNYRNIDNGSDQISVINHTFILPVREKNIHLIMSLLFPDTDIENKKSIYIHPVQSWMSIEKLN